MEITIIIALLGFLAVAGLVTAVVALDAYLVGHIAAKAWALLMVPHLSVLPTLPWVFFAGIALISGLLTMKVDNEAGKNDESLQDIFVKALTVLMLKLMVCVAIWYVIDWIA